MEENTKPKEQVKALNVDIAKILKNTPDAIAINIYYVVKGNEIDLRGMEILSPPTPEQPK